MRPLTVLALLFVGLVVFTMGCSSYNGFIDSEENVKNAWSKVESAYQRRADLIPNLVNTVKGAADFERNTLTEVTNARARATSVNIDPSNLSAEQIKKFSGAQSELSGALGRLLVSVERYPELKATKAFSELQAQLEGTENRIKVERDKFNDVVTGYNKSIRRFPSGFFAGVFGFDQMAQFDADEGAEKAPTVDFGDK